MARTDFIIARYKYMYLTLLYMYVFYFVFAFVSICFGLWYLLLFSSLIYCVVCAMYEHDFSCTDNHFSCSFRC